MLMPSKVALLTMPISDFAMITVTDTDFRFAWVKKSAGTIVLEIWFMVFQCYKRIPAC